MKWLKRLFALIGFAMVTLVALSLGAYYFIFDKSPRQNLPEAFVLEVDLRQGMSLGPSDDPLAIIGPGSLSLDDLVLRLLAAQDDERVKGLLIRISETSHGMAFAQEMAETISEFSKAGKATAAWADSFGELTPGTEGYLIASAAQKIGIQPGGYVGLTGFSFEQPYLGSFLRNFGIEPVVFRRSEFKTALNSFAEPQQTEPGAAMMNALADRLFDQIASEIALNREMDANAVGSAIDESPLSSSRAEELGLIDEQTFWFEFRSDFANQNGAFDQFVSLKGYDRSFGDGAKENVPKLALLSLEGNIIRGDGHLDVSIAADRAVQALKSIKESDVDIVVLRLNSGGGSAVASSTIANEIQAIVASGKPLIVSMTNAAASGGYWIAAPATTILAQATTFTGSIGVVAGKPVVQELLKELDIQVAKTSRGQHADLWSFFEPLDDAGSQKLNAALDEVYSAFKMHVSAHRPLDIDQIEAVAKGRVWLGADALENGLVDKNGGLVAAIEEAAAQLGRDNVEPNIVRYPRSSDWLGRVIELVNDPFGLIESRLRSYFGLDQMMGVQLVAPISNLEN